jgi:type II secretory ATPase GspE/PulE/Tfp pilus assembly ATPase PilB-like protein
MPEVSKKTAGTIEISAQTEEEIKNSVKNISKFREKIEESLTADTSQMLEIIMGGAINFDASDIHIEPEEAAVKIRARVDGNLQDVVFVDKKIYESVLSRIKLLSGLKFNVSDRPQDGRFTVLWSGTEIEIRSSTIPAEYGESIVMRILNPKSLISMEELGLRKDLFEQFKKEIKKPNGMIIVTGPTGSGKTTTLYAFLKEIYDPEIKIITIEDPIEYHLQGVSQTQTAEEKGYDFANGLRSIMRQDPDVILVGEIRDLETADIALQAALTGHLVFSTLHTNDAAGTITRLVSLGANLANIGPAINMAVAQRLVRKICKSCAQERLISPEELKKIEKGLKGIPKTVEVPKFGPKTKLMQPKGCPECNSSGYRGRAGIFEAFLVNDNMEKFILTSPSIAALKEKAVKDGMVTMYQDGLIKILNGLTTFEEVEKTTGEFSE